MSKLASDSEHAADIERRCTNCGAGLTRAFCAVCGQKDVSLDRPAIALLRDLLDGFFSLDGKFWQTVLRLYRKPGLAARYFIDGQRAGQSPPVRLYLIAALIFVAGFQASGIAFIGIQTERGDLFTDSAAGEPELAQVGSGPINVNVSLFRPPWVPEPEPIDWEAVRQAVADSEGLPLEESSARNITEEAFLDRGGATAFAVLAGRDPLGAERAANLALSQAAIAMVILFAVFNFLVHPKARLVTHVVHSLYFHAALMPLVMVGGISAIYLSALSQAAGAILGAVVASAALVLAWLSDRAVYESSWYGASLRLVFLVVVYFISLIAISLTLILMAVSTG